MLFAWWPNITPTCCQRPICTWPRYSTTHWDQDYSGNWQIAEFQNTNSMATIEAEVLEIEVLISLIVRLNCYYISPHSFSLLAGFLHIRDGVWSLSLCWCHCCSDQHLHQQYSWVNVKFPTWKALIGWDNPPALAPLQLQIRIFLWGLHERPSSVSYVTADKWVCWLSVRIALQCFKLLTKPVSCVQTFKSLSSR